MAAAAVGCGDPPGESTDDVGVDDTGMAGDVGGVDMGAPDAASGPDGGGDAGVDMGPLTYPAANCDALDEAECAMPWPSNLFMAPDDTRQTGYTLTFSNRTLPASVLGRSVDPQPYRRLDGYGLGTPLLTVFPDIDVSQMAGQRSIERSLEPDAPIVWLAVAEDGSTSRVPYFVELDSYATEPDETTLFVRPAVILEEATRYVVAFRDLRRTDGSAIEPSEAFRRLRDGDLGDDEVLQRRAPRFEEIFNILEDENIARDDLTLAWDFVTASSDALHGPMLHVRDAGFAAAGPRGPALEVQNVTEYVAADDGSGLPVHEHIALEIEATMEVPHFMEEHNAYKWRFHRDASGQIVQNGTRTADVLVRVPHTALDGTPHGLVTYGHGLFGSRHEIRAGHLGLFAHDYNFIMVAVDLTGMSHVDLENAESAVLDMSGFVAIADRLHQGMLEYLLVTRSARERLGALDALTTRNVSVDADRQYYFGGSQGGIFGATFMALTPDIERGFLAVPGNNYSTLLTRSTNFEPFLEGLESTYRPASRRALLLSTVQLLWDNTDPVSYLRRIRHDPLGQREPRDVLLAAARGDYQVSVLTNEIVARTRIGIPLLENYDDVRDPWDAPVVSYPHTGSGTVLYHFGNPWPDPGNLPPMDGLGDPHGKLSEVEEAGTQIEHFFRTGEIIDVCGGKVCSFDVD
jgi:hypothetical protein